MKKNNDLKQATVILVAYILVIGFVGAGGFVDGQSVTNDISVTASQTKVEVWDFSIDNATENNTIISENATTGDFGYSEPNANQVNDVFISLKVYDSNDVSQNISEAHVWINSTNTGNQANDTGVTQYGDAISGYNNTWEVTETSTEAYLNISWSGGSNQPFLLYGNWQIESKITNSTVGTIDRADYVSTGEGVPFDMTLYRTISVTSPSISGTAAPGQTLTTNSSTGDQVKFDSADSFEFSINDDYELEAQVSDLTHTTKGYTIGSDNWTTDYGDHNQTTTPTNLENFDPLNTDENAGGGYYTLSIPAGIAPGEYTGTITHYVNQTSPT